MDCTVVDWLIVPLSVEYMFDWLCWYHTPLYVDNRLLYLSGRDWLTDCTVLWLTDCTSLSGGELYVLTLLGLYCGWLTDCTSARGRAVRADPAGGHDALREGIPPGQGGRQRSHHLCHAHWTRLDYTVLQLLGGASQRLLLIITPLRFTPSSVLASGDGHHVPPVDFVGLLKSLGSPWLPSLAWDIIPGSLAAWLQDQGSLDQDRSSHCWIRIQVPVFF